ncbi:MAG: pyrroline-5-carboxylate reductase [Clostridiales bacterium]|nr:pyrroline-5-carboxylate reductase [Clostridiales bacterium]
MQWNLGVIGAGNMATSIIEGILKKEVFAPKNIYVYDIDSNKLSSIASKTGVVPADSNIDLVTNCKVFIIAVKPHAYDSLLKEISNHITHEHLLISIAAGISTDYIKQKIYNKCKIVRVMPNTPALVGEGMTAICINQEINKNQREIVNLIFSSLGRVEEVEESLIDAVTAISGSSPAYIYVLIEALADGGVLMGLPRDQAYRMAAQSVLGAAKMVLELEEHPGILKDMVCSPGGTTIEAIYTLEKNNFRGSVMEAVRNCALKAGEINNKNNKKNQ